MLSAWRDRSVLVHLVRAQNSLGRIGITARECTVDLFEASRSTRSAAGRNRYRFAIRYAAFCGSCDRLRRRVTGSPAEAHSCRVVAHRDPSRRMSAPLCLMMSCGSIELPERLRHLSPRLRHDEAVGDTTETARDRACPGRRAASSETSRDADRSIEIHVGGPVSSGRTESTDPSWLDPESNQTSRYSSPSKTRAAALRAGTPRRARAAADVHTRRRSVRLEESGACSTSAGVTTTSPPTLLRMSRRIGTPHARCVRCTSRAIGEHVVDAVVAPRQAPKSPDCDGRAAASRSVRARFVPCRIVSPVRHQAG